MRTITHILSALLIASLSFPLYLSAQNIGDFRTSSTGNWNSAAIWETYNGSTWVRATTPPNGSAITAILIQHAVVITDSIALIGNVNLSINNAGILDIYKAITNNGTIQNEGIINWYDGNINTTDNLTVGNILNNRNGSINIQIFNDASTINQRISNAGSLFKFGNKTLIINELSNNTGIFDSDNSGILVHYDGLLDIKTSSTWRGSIVNFGTIRLSHTNGMNFTGFSFQNENIVQGNFLRIQGTEPQQIKGTGRFERLLIRNPTTINILNNLTFENELQLIWGRVNLSGNGITIGTSISNLGTFIGGSDTAYFYNGTFRRWVNNPDTIRFPVGIASAYLQALIIAEAQNGGGLVSLRYTITDPLTWGLTLFDNNSFGITSTCPTCGVWEVSTSNDFISRYKLILTLTNYPGITRPRDLRIIYRPVPSSPWQIRGEHGEGSGTSPRFIAQRNNLNVFGEFAIGGSASNPLPVELTAFNAIRKGNTGFLTWETASELNAHYFEIERSTDAKIFNSLGEIKATGNSTTVSKYQFIDENPQKGIQYYRLKIVDEDGSFRYSHIKSINFENKLVASIYPNPVKEKLIIETTLEDASKPYNIDVLDITGRVYLSNKNMDNQQLNLDVKHLAKGIYFVKMTQENAFSVFKFVKN